MRADAIRTFAGGYHWGARRVNRIERGHLPGPVASTRTLLGVLGLAFAVVGIVVAWIVDRLAGMAFLIVGAFLLILPFTRPRDE